jgi:tellurite resistance protein TerC
MIDLFPFAEYWWFYLGFTAFVFFLLALDLGVFHRKAHEVSFREAATWSVVWVALALGFNYLL